MAKSIIKSLAAFLAMFGITLACLVLFLKPLAETFLRKAGHPQATVGRAVLEADGLALERVDLGNGIAAEEAHVSVDFDSLLARKMNAASLAVKGASVKMDTLWGSLPLRGDGKMLPSGAGWRWNAEISGEAPFAQVSGRLTSEITPGAPAKHHFELGEGRVTTEEFSAKRLTGWIAFGPLGVSGGQLMAGAVEGQGARLQDVTVTFTAEGEIMMSGAAPTGTRLYVDFRKDGVFCNGSPAPFAVQPVPAEIMRLAQACLQKQ